MKNKQRTKGKTEESSELNKGVSQKETESRIKKGKKICVETEQEEYCAMYNKEDTYGIEEPWLSIETKLIAGSLIIGIVALVILATLVDIFLLKV
ncbi:MAG: hypothetical protein SWO11_18310 [Thermodesulfobacteriota bacterium]|nr:hypothetical protein [Thermodesulfobacteriota bacterium]